MSASKWQGTKLRDAEAGVLPPEDGHPKDARQAWRDMMVTDAELDAWEEQVLGQKQSAKDPVLRLIGEVRRLRKALRGVDQSTAIVRDPERCAGDPILEGTRTAVHDVVSYARAFNGDLERVRDEALPHLSMKQVRAAMAYYAEHTEEIEEILRQRREEYARTPEAPVRK
jgi:uncharacterized protein (DUF433 family)